MQVSNSGENDSYIGRSQKEGKELKEFEDIIKDEFEKQIEKS